MPDPTRNHSAVALVPNAAALVLNAPVAPDVRDTLAALEQQHIPFVPALVTPAPDGGRAGKQPHPEIASWRKFMTAPAPRGLVQTWVEGGLFEGDQRRGGYGGVGVILSAYSRLVCVDLDTPDAILLSPPSFQTQKPTLTQRTPDPAGGISSTAFLTTLFTRANGQSVGLAICWRTAFALSRRHPVTPSFAAHGTACER